MERRINQLISREGFDGLASFFSALQGNKDLLHKFYNYLTINTSAFYRDQKIYNYIQENALVDLLKQHRQIKIWSVGCSHGEEPYTLALILDQLSALDRVRITASDIDDRALEMARAGRYTAGQVEKVPPRILQKAFKACDGLYQVDLRYKKVIEFNKKNFLEPIYKNMAGQHLVLCRNVFIYFKTEVQEWIIDQISKIILPGGYFIIGCAEFINKPERFNLERQIPSIYKKLPS
jgi:chemotaxis protein methyltransferase CheR